MNVYISNTVMNIIAKNIRNVLGSSSSMTPSQMESNISSFDSITCAANILNGINTKNAYTFFVGTDNIMSRSFGIMSGTSLKHIIVKPYNNSTASLNRTFQDIQPLSLFFSSSIKQMSYSSGSSSRPFSNNPVLYTDALTAPSTWGQYWNTNTSSQTLTVHYGVSENEYLDIISS